MQSPFYKGGNKDKIKSFEEGIVCTEMSVFFRVIVFHYVEFHIHREVFLYSLCFPN